MSTPETRSATRPNRRLLAAFAIGAAGLAITGSGVYAALNATATTAQNASSGILSLTMEDNGTGFSQAVSNLAPGDVVNRYVNLTQGANLDGKDLTLKVTDSTPTPTLLTTSADRGLRVKVTQCDGTWTPGTGAGSCDGTTTVLLSDAALSTLGGTPVSIKPGSIATGSIIKLQIALTLPEQTETTVNGDLPANTIQGLSSALTWTFSETQRTATTTGS